MKRLIKITIFVFAICIFLSCSKKASRTYSGNDQQPPPPPPIVNPCNNRPVIKAKLIPVGTLSVGRFGLVSATAGSKILFAGGMNPGTYSSRVDIYDTIANTWTTAELTIPERQGMAVATIGKKIFFAGGQNADWFDVTSRIDIYDASTNSWSTAELSSPRAYLATVTIGSKVFFAGGGNWGPNYFMGSKVVDIYDNNTNTWTTDSLSEGRYELSATIAGNKIYFAGGINNIFNISNTIDIFDVESNTWSTSLLTEAKTGHASIAINNKIFWAGGAKNSYQAGYKESETVEAKDITTGISSFYCITPKHFFKALMKDDNIIFFTGNLSYDPYTGTYFEIYNTRTDQWTTAVLDKQINDATIISVNNTIYVAGGRNSAWSDGYNQVWKLEF